MPGPRPLFQRKFKCEATGMKMIFYSHANKNHFHDLALSLVSKVRVFGTQKWPITSLGKQRFRIPIKHLFWDLKAYIANDVCVTNLQLLSEFCHFSLFV